ncbi:GTP-binding protein [Marinobacter sp. SS21]|uniref:GTP-binding protein n=1 Tax=Marinobacter sp. SS21 TaxID=2979460 RepID=UPI00232FD352|nr:GTPase domain-containing protein [Marinobacter sp. SS21]MDC0663774.1 GTPase domain-containing protein [Marinobacter sp. SS21]
MAEFDKQHLKLVFKIVFYGPALSGKTTNLMQLHTLLAPERKGELMVLETKDDRTLFFDLLPIGFRSGSGLDLRLKLYTVPGQVQHDSTRKAVLSRADGVVFVADSQHSQQHNNASTFENLDQNLQKVGIDIAQIPLAIQFNKRDLTDIIEEAALHQRWQATPWPPVIMASAIRGQGVLETFQLLLRRLYVQINPRYGLADRFQIDEATFVALLSRADTETGDVGL